jgi:NAD(P)H-dependent FMN reductase
LAASPGRWGGVRSLWHSRQPFEVLGVHVFPGMMGLADAYNAFDPQGRLKDEKTAEQLKKTVDQFIKHVKG